MKSPLFFKGIIDPKNPRSTLQLGINSNADPRTIDSHFKSASRIKEIMGVTWRYHHTGASATRRGGFEVKLTQVNPRQQGEAHRWGIIFPLATKWIYVDLVAAPGGFTRDEFEGIGFNIMKSIAISD